MASRITTSIYCIILEESQKVDSPTPQSKSKEVVKRLVTYFGEWKIDFKALKGKKE